VSGIAKADFSFKRMGIVTGFLSPEESHNFVFTNKIPKSELQAKSFVPGQRVNETAEALERKNFRKLEAPLHPVRTFVGRVVFFGIDEGTTLKPDGQFTFHSHTGQVPVGIDNIQRFFPKLINKRVDLSLKCNLFDQLPVETSLEIFAEVKPTFQVFQQLPLVCKLFSHLAYQSALWKNINGAQKTPIYDSVDDRTLWQHAHLKPYKERLHQNTSVLLTMRALGKPFSLDTYANCQQLGRFILRQGLDIVGGGIVVDTEFDGEEREHYWST